MHPLTHVASRVSVLALSMASIAFTGQAHAQDAYPSHPINIVVGYSAGGANDILARILADKMSSMLKQSVIVENKPGVASIIGATYVAKADPDGYTLFMGASGPISFNPALYKSLPYSPTEDFVPISLVGTFPLVLLTQTANEQTDSLEGLKAYAAKHPDKANYSASAASFQLMTELFKKQTGTQFEYIPYKGSMDSITAVSTGDATITLVDTGPATRVLPGGRIRALAVTSGERTQYLPDVPTMKELGIDMNVELWSGLFAPAGTPPEVVQKLEQTVHDALQAPDVQKRIAALAITPKSATSKAFSAMIDKEITLWKRVAREANIPLN